MLGQGGNGERGLTPEGLAVIGAWQFLASQLDGTLLLPLRPHEESRPVVWPLGPLGVNPVVQL